MKKLKIETPRIARLRVSPFIDTSDELDRLGIKDQLIRCDDWFLPNESSGGLSKEYLKMILRDQVYRLKKSDVYTYMATVTPKLMALKYAQRVPLEIVRLNTFLKSIGMKSLGFEKTQRWPDEKVTFHNKI